MRRLLAKCGYFAMVLGMGIYLGSAMAYHEVAVETRAAAWLWAMIGGLLVWAVAGQGSGDGRG